MSCVLVGWVYSVLAVPVTLYNSGKSDITNGTVVIVVASYWMGGIQRYDDGDIFTYSFDSGSHLLAVGESRNVGNWFFNGVDLWNLKVSAVGSLGVNPSLLANVNAHDGGAIPVCSIRKTVLYSVFGKVRRKDGTVHNQVIRIIAK